MVLMKRKSSSEELQAVGSVVQEQADAVEANLERPLNFDATSFETADKLALFNSPRSHISASYRNKGGRSSAWLTFARHNSS